VEGLTQRLEGAQHTVPPAKRSLLYSIAGFNQDKISDKRRNHLWPVNAQSWVEYSVSIELLETLQVCALSRIEESYSSTLNTSFQKTSLQGTMKKIETDLDSKSGAQWCSKPPPLSLRRYSGFLSRADVSGRRVTTQGS
jgi:hypothetical protein